MHELLSNKIKTEEFLVHQLEVLSPYTAAALMDAKIDFANGPIGVSLAFLVNEQIFILSLIMLWYAIICQ